MARTYRLPMRVHPPSVRRIIAEQAAFFDTTVKDLLGRSLFREHVNARHSAMRRCRDEIRIDGKAPSFPRIASWFGRDHTSIIDAYYGTGRGNRLRVPKVRKNSSGFEGICWSKRESKWRVYLRGGAKHVGYYPDLMEAVEARRAAGARFVIIDPQREAA